MYQYHIAHSAMASIPYHCRLSGRNFMVHHIQNNCKYPLALLLMISSNSQMVQMNPMMIIEQARNKPKILVYLPMFSALHDHPDSTIQALVECFPQCLAMPATVPKARLPLHLACIYENQEKYPDVAQVHSNKTKLPLHYASANLSITPKTVQPLAHVWPQSFFEFCPANNDSNTNDTDDNKEETINDFHYNWH